MGLLLRILKMRWPNWPFHDTKRHICTCARCLKRAQEEDAKHHRCQPSGLEAGVKP